MASRQNILLRACACAHGVTFKSPAAITGALASFVPSCALAYVACHWWERFRDRAWQRRFRQGLAPVTLGLIIAGGYVMACSSSGWTPAAVTLAAAAGAALRPRLSPLW